MKKNTKKTPTETPAPTTPAPHGPSVRAIMHRISSLTAAAARNIADGHANTLPEILREIDLAARTYWKNAQPTA